jgi:hypothetical protein
VDVVGAVALRAEVLRAAYKATAGVPVLSCEESLEVALPQITKRDIRFMQLAGADDLALLNAVLSAEAELREAEFVTLERLLAYCQFSDGDLDERLLALPDRAFARAATALYDLSWATG